MLNAKDHKIDSFVIDVFLMRLWDLWRSDYGDGFEQLLAAAKLPAAAAVAAAAADDDDDDYDDDDDDDDD